MSFKSSSWGFKKTILGVGSLLMLSSVHAAMPLWSLTPAPGSQTVIQVAPTGTATAQYIVQNNSNQVKRLVIKPMPGVSQAIPCQLAPAGQAGSRCTLTLAISGKAIPAAGIKAGPILCQANANNSPNLNQCYQPSATNQLTITRSRVVSNTVIGINLQRINFPVDGSQAVTITNNSISAQPALNVRASIPLDSALNQTNDCPALLAVGANCTITFSANSVVSETMVPIKGANTNTLVLPITVSSEPQASLNTNQYTTTNPLIIETNTTGNVTLSNTSTTVAATGIEIVPNSTIALDNRSTCTATLPANSSCTIVISSATVDNNNSVSIRGDNFASISFAVNVVSSGTAILNSSVQTLALSVRGTGALTGNPRQITITNTGTADATNVAMTPANLPTGVGGTTVFPLTCPTITANGALVSSQ